jgi:hypothetical protein
MEGNNSQGRVGKLFSKTRRWKKQSSRESFGSTTSSEDAPRGRSPHSREPFYYEDTERTERTRSTSISKSIEIMEEEAEDARSPSIDEYEVEL